MEKHRVDDNTVDHGDTIYDMKGANVIIADDILATASTVTSAVGRLENTGWVDVYAVHGVMPRKGHDNLQSMTRPRVGKIRHVATSDTMKNDFERVSIIDKLVGYFESEVA